MTDVEALTTAVADLIEVSRLQAHELLKLANHLELNTTAMPEPNQVPLILSELSELHRRVSKLSTAAVED